VPKKLDWWCWKTILFISNQKFFVSKKKGRVYRDRPHELIEVLVGFVACADQVIVCKSTLLLTRCYNKKNERKKVLGRSFFISLKWYKLGLDFDASRSKLWNLMLFLLGNKRLKKRFEKIKRIGRVSDEIQFTLSKRSKSFVRLFFKKNLFSLTFIKKESYKFFQSILKIVCLEKKD